VANIRSPDTREIFSVYGSMQEGSKTRKGGKFVRAEGEGTAAVFRDEKVIFCEDSFGIKCLRIFCFLDREIGKGWQERRGGCWRAKDRRDGRVHVFLWHSDPKWDTVSRVEIRETLPVDLVGAIMQNTR
jgi:hypothetical protein